MDPKEQIYGKLLFQEPEHELGFEKRKRLRASILWFGGGIIIIIFSIYIILFVIVEIMFLSIGLVILIRSLLFFKWYNEIDTYKIYERGIYMASKKASLLEFKDIEHIKLGYDSKNRNNFFLIKKSGEKMYHHRFGDRPTRGVTIVLPKYYKKMLKIIIKQLIKLYPDIDESELIYKQ